MSRRSSRRDFLKQGTLAGVGFWVAGGIALSKSKAANEKISIACIGVGGKGDSDCEQAGKVGNVVAICDIDDDTLNHKAEKFPKAKKYNDYRKMLQEKEKEIDAVTVSTPDHTHAPASLMAMKMGKHVYCQKPLTHTVTEARLMRETAKKYKVATQMGNQGTAEDGLRRAVEIVQAGVLGAVTEAHIWTNRPIWPQGADAVLQIPAARDAAYAAMHGKAAGSPQLPQPAKHVHWDLWLGTAPWRPYAGPGVHHGFAWRGWWDFGTGAVGDMACHTANMAFMALKLGYPTSVVARRVHGLNPETCPTGARVVFQFPEREGMAPVKLTWYEGIDKDRNKYLPPTKLFHGHKPPGSGSLLVGEKGILYSPDDYGAAFMFLGDNAEDIKAAAEKVEKRLPRNGKGDDGMKEEWVEAIRNGKPHTALSNFDYAAMLTETMLLANVAMRAGKKIEWNGPEMKITNVPEANQYLRTEYRKGWEL
ncbi:MAG TPA: Gfo/Idh/MocA family oxidoreductase [Gemmataceae bacterium]|jgi:predicted dehydrogenase|nr:Gfo/Idh/MocA family oxidoreductase [Gemmataceae bacterium]